MSDYEPQVGDTVRVTLEGRVTELRDPSGSFSLHGIRSHGWAAAVSVELIDRPAPVEEWQPGDVVRNADDPEDARAWIHAPRETNPEMCWLYVHGNGNTDRLCRDDLPTNLRLLVRDGQPVPQPEDKHPQPGDVVTEEPPVGSEVRDCERDVHSRLATGWVISQWRDGSEARDNEPRDFEKVNQYYGPLTLVRWGAGQ